MTVTFLQERGSGGNNHEGVVLGAGTAPKELLRCERGSYRQQNRASDGSGEEPPDVRGAGGGGGPQRADQGADREELPAGAGEHAAKDARQPRAARPVPGAAADWFPTFLFPVTRDCATARPAGVTGVGALRVVPGVAAVVVAVLGSTRSEKD
uniref:TSC22 domain family member 1 n=1 Tax=Dromaius novaehollandiae TaxID=8790 RepID=A0A8C4PAK1_DRONO